MEGKNITVGNASKIFADFEHENANYLSTLYVHQYSLWQIVKWPVSSFCLRNANQNVKVLNTPAIQKNIFIRLTSKAKTIFQTLILLLYLRKKKYPKYLFITNSVDKLALDENDLYYNSLMDPVIDYFKQNRICFLHYEHDIKAKQPSYRNGLYDISKINLIKKIIKVPVIDCKEFVNKINSSFESNKINTKITDGLINQILFDFFSQKKIWLKIFKRSKPKRIFTSEITNTGFLAACKELNIEVFEFQHGTIDKNHPAYTIQKNIVENAIELKPKAYAVFGPSTRQILRMHQFNDSIDIIELGKKNIEDARNAKTVSETKRVLLCLQPFMEQLNLDILNIINKEQENINFKVTLKFHPLQNEDEQNKLMAAISNNKKIELASITEGIYKLIIAHDITIAHTSNVLEECISLNRPAITIGTFDTPNGILEILDMQNLKFAIKPTGIDDIIKVVNKFYNDYDFKNTWLEEVNKYKNFFYANNYYDNIKRII